MNFIRPDSVGRRMIKVLDPEQIENFSRDDPKKFLDREDVSLQTKFGYLKNLLMKNNIETLVRVEKFLINTIQEDNLTIYQKFRLVDDFCSLPNGMMLYKTVEWIHYTVIELHWILFKMNIDAEYKVQALNFLLRSNMQKHRKDEAIRELQTIAINGQNTMATNKLANIIDLLLNSNADQTIVTQLMTTLRTRKTIDEQKRHDGLLLPLPVPLPPNIYKDTQNVHDSSINNSIKKFLDILAKDTHKDTYKYKILDKNPIELIDEIEAKMFTLPFYCNKISTSLNRISTDYSIFSSHNQLRLRDILQRVWNRIMNNMEGEMQAEVIKRLAEELKDMSGMCSTGHMSRIVNTLNGFDPDLVISISWSQQITANISARINTELKKEENENLLNAMIETDENLRKPYLVFIENLKKPIYTELLKEYSGVIKNGDFSEKQFTEIFEQNYKNFCK